MLSESSGGPGSTSGLMPAILRRLLRIADFLFRFTDARFRILGIMGSWRR
jgi:hypothetical protein